MVAAATAVAWAVAMVQATEATAAARLAAWVAGGGLDGGSGEMLAACAAAVAPSQRRTKLQGRSRLNPVRAHAIRVLSARVHALASAGFEPSRAP